MATNVFRLNVTAAQFPFLSDQEGSSVIVPGQDTYFVRPNAFTGETADKNIGIPQFTFLENVMPTSYGVQSVGYSENPITYPDNLLQTDQLIYLRSQTGRRYLANFNRQNGKFFILSPELNQWLQVLTTGLSLSHAYTCMVKGRCFFYFKNGGALYEFKGYNTITNVFDFATMNTVGGISNLTPMYGLTSANNYLIFFTRTLVFYTIPSEVYGVAPDFTPSLGPTGAATETPSVLKGVIITCLPTQDGYYMFTSTNTIAVYYSGNIKFPWTYRELENSAALVSLDSIAADRDGYPKYYYSSAGLLKIGKSQCTPTQIEASEFIGNTVFELFDWTNKEVQRFEVGETLATAYAYVANRWLVISYGFPGQPFEVAIIWDEHLKRWGKARIQHSRAIEYFGIPATIPSILGLTYGELLDLGHSYQKLLDLEWSYAYLGGANYAGNPDLALEYMSLGFVSLDGNINVMNFDNATLSDLSVAILGRVAFTRTSRFKITDVWLERVEDTPTTENSKLAILPSNDMKNAHKTVYGFKKLTAAGGVRKYQFPNCEGINHQMRFEGDFQLATIVVVGKRTGHAYN